MYTCYKTFELCFAEPESLSPKPKRSLNFTTPNTKPLKKPATDSSDTCFTPLKSPAEPLNGSLFGRNLDGLSVGSGQKKRPRDSPTTNQSDSDLEYDDDDLSSTGRVIFCTAPGRL